MQHSPCACCAFPVSSLMKLSLPGGCLLKRAPPARAVTERISAVILCCSVAGLCMQPAYAACPLQSRCS